MRTLINNLIKTGELVSIYRGDNLSSFIFGKIILADDNYYALSCVSPYGEQDGLLIAEINEIIKIETGEKYNRKIERICKIKNTIIPNYELNHNAILESTLQLSYRNKKIITVNLIGDEHENIVGFVEKITDNICTITLIDDYGSINGKVNFKLHDVTLLSYDSQDENLLELMVNYNNK